MLIIEKFLSNASRNGEKDTKPTRDELASERFDSSALKVKMGVALPKITVKKFTGEPTTWQQFYDTIRTTVDKHERLSEIEKFTYLKGRKMYRRDSTIRK